MASQLCWRKVQSLTSKPCFSQNRAWLDLLPSLYPQAPAVPGGHGYGGRPHSKLQGDWQGWLLSCSGLLLLLLVRVSLEYGVCCGWGGWAEEPGMLSFFLGLLLLCLMVVGMRWAKGSVVDTGHKSGSVHPGAGAVLGSSWHWEVGEVKQKYLTLLETISSHYPELRADSPQLTREHSNSNITVHN